MSRSTRKVPIKKHKPDAARKIRRSFHHALRQAIKKFIKDDPDGVIPMLEEVSDEYTLCDSIEDGYRNKEDRERIKRK